MLSACTSIFLIFLRTITLETLGMQATVPSIKIQAEQATVAYGIAHRLKVEQLCRMLLEIRAATGSPAEDAA